MEKIEDLSFILLIDLHLIIMCFFIFIIFNKSININFLVSSKFQHRTVPNTKNNPDVKE